MHALLFTLLLCTPQLTCISSSPATSLLPSGHTAHVTVYTSHAAYTPPWPCPPLAGAHSHHGAPFLQAHLPRHGRMAASPHGSLAAWPHGSLAAWQHGHMAASPHGSLAAWQHGSLWLVQAAECVSCRGARDAQGHAVCVVQGGERCPRPCCCTPRRPSSQLCICARPHGPGH